MRRFAAGRRWSLARGWAGAVSLLAFLAVPSPRAAPGPAEPGLRIISGGETRAFTRSTLLGRSDLTRIDVPHDPAYGGEPMSYQAVPFHRLWEGIALSSDAHLLFRCADGFSVSIARERALSVISSAAVAYLAVESPQNRWPPTRKGVSPGPFYLIWKDPEKSGIHQEEWPFQLAAVEVTGDLARAFPRILPDPKAPASVRRGYTVFVQNCLPCHTLNRQGESRMGPDLNVPMNITEYWRPEAIRALVRDPDKVRHWPEGKMTTFSKDQLPDADLDDLLVYLQHMAGRKAE